MAAIVHVKRNSRLGKNNSVALTRLPRKPIHETIRERITALLAAHPDKLNQKQFAEAFGRSEAWASHLLDGTRALNNVQLLVRIARFFRVPPSYLLDEPAAADSLVSEISAVCAGLTKDQQEVVLRVARSLPPPSKGTPPTR
jgi:transcriptional regulator with XRE-family HTH domain